MTAEIRTVNATVAQIEGRLKAGESVQKVADALAEPAVNVYAAWRDLRARGLVEGATEPPATPRPGPRPLASVPTPPGSASAPTVDTLAAAAARSTSKRTQALGVKLHDLAGVLRQRLNEEREQAERAEKDRAERQAAAAEVERLRAQLREAEAKLRPRGSASRTSRPGRPLAPINHGTNAGYNQHKRRGEAACDACAQAHRDYNDARKASAS